MIHEREAPQALTADENLVRASLAYHYQGVPGLLSICSDADRWAGRRFTTDETGIDAATQYVMRLDRQRPKGIYAQVTTLRDHPAKGRGGKDLAHAVTLLWADGDYGTTGHKPGPDDMPHPIDAQHVREIVEAAGLPEPSGWWLSGGGCNPIWQLDQPRTISDDTDRAAVEQLTMGIQAILGASAYGHGCGWDTQVGNLDRLMRIPGTVNRKGDNERPTSSLPGTGEPISFEVMRDAVARLEPDARRVLEKAAQAKRARQDERTGRTSAPAPTPRRNQSFPGNTGTGVFDILALGLTFRDILEPAGWTYRGTAGDGRHKWLRPAGAEGSPDSEYSLICDDHVAVNWSERSGLPVGQQAAGRKLTVPTLWAHLHYNGDEREAALDVLRAAFGQTCGPAARSLPQHVLGEIRHRCRPPAAPAPVEDIWAAPAEEPDSEPEPGDEGAPAPRRGLLPESFWAARPVFQHIRQAAHSQGCSGDLVLYSTLARLSGMLSHHVRAVTGIGGRASLNVFAAMVGTSGAGKSISAGCVRDLMAPADDDFRDGLPIGTGEGIAEAFMGTVEEPTGELHLKGPLKGDPVMQKVRKQVRHNAFFYVDEGQSLAKLGERSGSILGETLRRAAIGEALGQTNASEERTRYIAPGSYSLGLLAGFQPSIATGVLADAHTGTPQRFYWGWADDPSIPDVPPPWPGPIEPHPGRLRPDGPVDIVFPERIKRMLWADRVARGRGEIEVSELDGHAGLMKVKLAALFALLDGGRRVVTEEDWALAETAWASSCAVRDALVLRAQREAAAERARAEDAKVHAELRSHVAKKDADLTLERVAHLVNRHASQVGGITYGALKKALASRDRPVAEKAVALAVTKGWVYEEGDRICVNTD
ncbi:MAG: hypothetical protein HOW97_33990 [Catenulispora sp.]|nr:hypothetical protein [Catenulispora sp.]